MKQSNEEKEETKTEEDKEEVNNVVCLDNYRKKKEYLALLENAEKNIDW